MNELVTIKVDDATLKQMKEHYQDFVVPNNGAYIFFDARIDGLNITGYSSKKSNKTVTFKGIGAKEEAGKWSTTLIEENSKETIPEHWVDLNEQIGSDEVGVGDLLLPMIVVASFIKKGQIKRLFELGIHDSKKMTDIKIREVGPILIKEFEYSKLTLPNKKYNEMIAKGENLNSLKAKMHNRALYNLTSKYPDVYSIYVDQFVNESKYYSYLNDKNEPQVKGISFKTKGESRFPCVALASVIARYYFLLEKDKLEKEISTTIPCGAGSQVDKWISQYLKKHSKEELIDLVKANFKNVKNIL